MDARLVPRLTRWSNHKIRADQRPHRRNKPGTLQRSIHQNDIEDAPWQLRNGKNSTSVK
jgi:hypothetical protein